MTSVRHIVCTVTNDLTYDQRMHRICKTLSEAGYKVTLVGRQLPLSLPLLQLPYQCKRITCRWHKGFLFYAEYNLKLLFFLLKFSCDAVCAVDFDTLGAVTLATLIRGRKRVFDAHEYFTEVPELVGRPVPKAFWGLVGRICLPFYQYAYTVGPSLARIFEQQQGLAYSVVRNVPSRAQLKVEQTSKPHALLYQGALNEGRGLEAAIEAMLLLPESVTLWIAGEGDRSVQLRQLATEIGLDESRVQFLGFVRPEDLRQQTNAAWLGLNLLENKGLSYYYSLANKFFDYVQAGVPVLTMNFPEYSGLLAEHRVGMLLDVADPRLIADAILSLLEDPVLYNDMVSECQKAAQIWNWEQEQTVLLGVWARVFR